MELILALWAVVSNMKLGNWPKCQKLHINSCSIPRVEIELIFALQAAVSEIRADFHTCHI